MNNTELTNQTIQDYKNGDERAFTTIYNHYRNRVYFMAYQYFKDEGLAEDIVQETFISLNKYIHKIDSVQSMNLYIKKTTYHRSMDILRKKKLDIQEDNENFTVEDYDDTSKKTINEEISAKEIQEAIIESLDTMSFDMKSVGTLRFYEGLSLEDISEILDIPKGTVKSRISRIKEKLKIDLEAKGITPELYTSSLTFAGLATIYTAMASSSSSHAMTSILAIKKPSKLSKAGKVALATTAIVAGGAIGANRDNIHNALTPGNKAEIVNVEFDKNYTRKDITLDVITSINNYDKIMVNNQENLIVTTNGSYKVTLVKDDEVVDSENIEINNIDKDVPYVTTSKQVGNQYMMSFADDLSGIDNDSLHYYLNGQESNNYEYNKSTKTLIIPFEKGSQNKILINDLAGNTLEVNVSLT